MGKTINVKVPTAKVIKGLQSALDNRKKQLADSDKGQKDYDKAREDFIKSVTESVLSGKAKVLETEVTSRYYTNNEPRVLVTCSMPKGLKEPQSDDFGLITGWAKQNIESEISELENAIRILKMTEATEVSTSTYSGVAKYL